MVVAAIRALGDAKAKGISASSRAAWSSPRGILARAAGTIALALGLSAVPVPAPAAPKDIQITKLTDVNFGTIANLGIDAVQNQSVCVFIQGPMKGYRVTAKGSGVASAFTLASGARTLAYDVEWNGASGQTTGSQLSPNTPLGGFNASATQQTCNTGPASDASLIVILRATALSAATAGSYSGTLTLLLGAE